MGKDEPSLEGLDNTAISVVSSKKVDTRQLIGIGDREKGEGSRDRSKKWLRPSKQGEQCRVCCAMFGGMLNTALVLFVSSLQTGMMVYKYQHRLRATVPGFLRHVGWISLPPALMGTTLHFLVCDALWSGRKNTYGMAWAKAAALNTCMWVGGIASCTIFWRYALRFCGSWGKKLYNRYPIPNERVEIRLIENPNMFWSGMGWTYWALGIVSGQFGVLGCAAFVTWQNKQFYMMSPVGPYSMACMPRWRREVTAKQAGMLLPDKD